MKIVIEELDNGWEVQRVGTDGPKRVFQRRDETTRSEVETQVEIIGFLEELFNTALGERREKQERVRGNR